MTDPFILQARLDALEMRIAHQDETIEELNKALIAQWTQIDQFSRQINALLLRLQDVENSRPEGPAHDPLPPHY